VAGLGVEVLGNDFQLRLHLPPGAAVTVNRTAGNRPLHASGGTVTWREHRLRHPRPDGTLQIGFTLAGTPVLIDLHSTSGSEPSPWPPLLLGVIVLIVGLLRPRWASGLAVSAFAVMLAGAAGGLLVGRGAVAAVVACVVLVVLSAGSAITISAMPERFRTLTAAGFAATALLLALAQLPMLYRAYPVSTLPDAVARALEAVALALAAGALAAALAARPWEAFEPDPLGITPVG
jgi:hypothetical protein